MATFPWRATTGKRPVVAWWTTTGRRRTAAVEAGPARRYACDMAAARLCPPNALEKLTAGLDTAIHDSQCQLIELPPHYSWNKD